MKDWHKQISAEEQRLFDLLADGELEETPRRELLASLDERPEGWRNCALALLEAQAWRRHAREVVQTGDLATSNPYAASLAAHSAPQYGDSYNRRRTTNERLRMALAIAGSFLLAFGLSWFFRGVFEDGAAGTGLPQVARSGDAGMTGGSLTTSATGDEGETAGSGMVTLATDGDESLEVPYVSADRFDPSLFAGQPAGVPEDLVRELERTGHQVRRSRQIVPFNLHDGRRLVLPVDQMDVRYVGREFQ